MANTLAVAAVVLVLLVRSTTGQLLIQVRALIDLKLYHLGSAFPCCQMLVVLGPSLGTSVDSCCHHGLLFHLHQVCGVCPPTDYSATLRPLIRAQRKLSANSGWNGEQPEGGGMPCLSGSAIAAACACAPACGRPHRGHHDDGADGHGACRNRDAHHDGQRRGCPGPGCGPRRSLHDPWRSAQHPQRGVPPCRPCPAARPGWRLCCRGSTASSWGQRCSCWWREAGPFRGPTSTRWSPVHG